MTRNSTPQEHAAVLVVGLGRFGTSVAESLLSLQHEVLAVDNRPEVVQRLSGLFTHVVEADSTDETAMRQLGAHEFSRAVVGIGTDLESSVLTVAVLVDVGVREIWAKAITQPHGRILERIGANHVVYPEQAMGQRVAHLVSGSMIDFIEFDDGFAIVRTRVPPGAIDRTLAESALRGRYGVTVVGTKRPNSDFVYARPETVVRATDQLIVCGTATACERFAADT